MAAGIMCRTHSTHYSQGAMCCTHSTDYSQGAFSWQERCATICTFETVPLASVFVLRHTLSFSLFLSRCLSLSLDVSLSLALVPCKLLSYHLSLALSRTLSYHLSLTHLYYPLGNALRALRDHLI